MNYFSVLLLSLSLISGSLFAQETVVLPNLERLASLASEHGRISQTIGLRPYLDSVDIGMSRIRFDTNTELDVFNAYGMGGSGLTLMTGVAK